MSWTGFLLYIEDGATTGLGGEYWKRYMINLKGQVG